MAKKAKAKKTKPAVRRRLVKGRFDKDTLQGPYVMQGELGDKLPQIDESVFYDKRRKLFVLDESTGFDAAPTDSPPVKKSARSIQREKLKEKYALAQGKVNQKELEYKSAPQERKPSLLPGLKKAQAARDEVKQELQKVMTSTQKVEEKQYVQETRPPFGRSELSRGRLPVLAEYDRKSDTVKLFFVGARSMPDGKLDCDLKKHKQCSYLVPVIRSILSKYVNPDLPTRGEMGYWAVPSWDWPKVSKELKAIPGIRVFGDPAMALDTKFKQLDMKANLVRDAAIVIPPGFEPKVGKYPDGRPAPFQKEGIKFLMSRDHAILADDMGLGKTYQAIIAAHSSVPKTQQILIICPAAVVGSWMTDIEKFAPGAGAIGFTSKWVNKNGQPSSRPEKVRFFVCSYQGASSQEGKAAVSQFLLSKQWGLVIVDEAHRLKKTTTLAHKFVDMLKTTRMWFLTGTPIANRVRDYYGLLKLAKHPIGKRADKFTEDYVPGSIKAGKLDIAETLEPLEKLGKDLAGYVLRRTKEEVLKSDLPTKYGGIAKAPRGFILYTLPADFAKALEEANDDGKSREALRHALAVAKVPGTWEVAQRVIDAGDKVVLFSTYTDVLQSFAEFCDDAKVLYIVISGQVSTLGKSAMVKLFQGEPLSTKEGEDEEKWAKKNLGQWYLNLVRYVPVSEWKPEDIKEAVRRFGKDERKWPHEIQVVLGQMVAASEGVTLTAADTLLFNDMDYMPSRHEQAEDRIYRLSKPGVAPPHSTVYIGYIFTNDPVGIDNSMFGGLMSKRAEIQTVYGATSKHPDSEYAKLRKQYVNELKGKKRNPSDDDGTLGM